MGLAERMALAGVAAVALAGCRQQPAEVKADSGREIYIARCAVCHGENEEGRPGMYPPLAGSEWVNGPPERLAAIILDGMQGPVGGYNAVMPGWRGYLRDAEIATLMTWLRQGKPAVTAVDVGRVDDQTDTRNAFWTAEDLKALRLR